MSLQPLPFALTVAGSKTMEVRLNDEKRRKIRVGDRIEFWLATDPGEVVVSTVAELVPAASFKELCAAYPPLTWGGAKAEDYTALYEYYTEAQEAEYGVLGIVLGSSTQI